MLQGRQSTGAHLPLPIPGAWSFFFINWVTVPFSAALGLITTGSLLLDAVLAGGSCSPRRQ